MNNKVEKKKKLKDFKNFKINKNLLKKCLRIYQMPVYNMQRSCDHCNPTIHLKLPVQEELLELNMVHQFCFLSFIK